jgi:SH3-like domain-containing protein
MQFKSARPYQNKRPMKKSFRPVALVLLPLLGWALFGLGLTMTGPTTITATITAAHAADDSQAVRLTVRGSGLPVPRFVTLKSADVNMRAGPGTEYPILWHYRKSGLPLRVEAEFGVWRKIVDHDGTTGWMHHSVVSLKRMALVTTSSARLYAEADDSAALVAVAERNALLELQSCPTQWCRVAAGDIRGWVSRTSLWGLVEDETLN